jgi:hypothetical protein
MDKDKKGNSYHSRVVVSQEVNGYFMVVGYVVKYTSSGDITTIKEVKKNGYPTRSRAEGVAKKLRDEYRTFIAGRCGGTGRPTLSEIAKEIKANSMPRK